MWPGLTMKDTAAARSDVGGAQESHPNDTLPVGRGADISAPSLIGQDDVGLPAEIKGREEGLGNGHQATPGGGPREGGDSGDGLEQQSDRFEALMSDMLGARGRLQNLPDEQRRAAAESLTMQMMAQFGLDEEDSDSD